MAHESKLNALNQEINELLYGTGDTIYFDNKTNVFKVALNDNSEVALSPDKLIDIL